VGADWLWKIAERRQDAARVGAHRRPDAASRAIAAPLAADGVALLEKYRLEAFGSQITSHDQARWTGADDSNLTHDPFTARLS
jgi:hypothetical protein